VQEIRHHFADGRLVFNSIYATPLHDRRAGRERATRGSVSPHFGRCDAN
jgi:hypothetical protein